MPGLHHPVPRPLGGDGEAVELARQADREIADVDHLLDLAEPFGEDLAAFPADQPAELLLLLAQLLAEQPHQLAAPRRRHQPPGEEGLLRPPDRGGDAPRRRRASTCPTMLPSIGETERSRLMPSRSRSAIGGERVAHLVAADEEGEDVARARFGRRVADIVEPGRALPAPPSPSPPRPSGRARLSP